MTRASTRPSRWTALLAAVALACAVLLFQIAHVTAAPAADTPAATAAMPCHEAGHDGPSKGHAGPFDRSCALHCSALFLPSLLPVPVPVFAAAHADAAVTVPASREPPTPERPPKA